MKLWAHAAAMLALASGLGVAQARTRTVTVVVQSSDVIYAAGTQASLAAMVGGTVPQAVIDIPAGTTAISAVRVRGSIACASDEGCITVDGFTYHDPDGLPNNYGYNTGYGSISGFNAPGEGVLVGVFLAPNGPSGSAPATLSYPPSSESVRVFRPLLDQTFFIGDGLTGDGSGLRQAIKVPDGASQLVLGISNSCNGLGPVGCYGGGDGSYWTVTYKLLH